MIYTNVSTPTYIHYKNGGVYKRNADGKYPSNTSRYSHRESRVINPSTGKFLRASESDLFSYTPTTSVTNRLYGKLRDELLGQTGEMLTSGLEWSKSLDMISGRARTIHGAFQAVRRFRFKEAARILNTAVPAKYKNLSTKSAKKKGLSPTGIWLEYWLGWAPMINEIYLAIDSLQKQPSSQVRHFSVGVVERSIKTYKNYQSFNNGRSFIRVQKTYSRKFRYTAYGNVRITNHNVYFADKMGLINPPLTFWQLQPFSFIVDWFANVGQCLGALTDFAGMAFSDTGTSINCETTASAVGTQLIYPSRSIETVNENAWCYCKERIPGALPTPRLAIVMLDKLSLTRAATSISLLVEIFLRK